LGGIAVARVETARWRRRLAAGSGGNGRRLATGLGENGGNLAVEHRQLWPTRFSPYVGTPTRPPVDWARLSSVGWKSGPRRPKFIFEGGRWGMIFRSDTPKRHLGGLWGEGSEDALTTGYFFA
jgi:hypothetical protein